MLQRLPDTQSARLDVNILSSQPKHLRLPHREHLCQPVEGSQLVFVDSGKQPFRSGQEKRDPTQNALCAMSHLFQEHMRRCGFDSMFTSPPIPHS